MFRAIITLACCTLFIISIAAILYLPGPQCVGLGIVLTTSLWLIQRDRWSVVRTHKWSRIRRIYQIVAIYNFAWRLDRAYSRLTPPIDAKDSLPGSSDLLKKIVKSGPDTYQKKTTNRLQIQSLLLCVYDLVQNVKEKGRTPLVLDIGAGKALFTRAVYEAFDRSVAVIALDNRKPKKESHKTGDMFYDPSTVDEEDEPYTRVVADVRYLAAKTLRPLKNANNGGAIAITKHLCGGATDGSIIALCSDPLQNFVGACCFAPCCHQKTKREQYCNIPFFESMGFCRTHIGLRGGVQDIDFKTFGMLISMSRAKDLQSWEYKKSILLEVLGFARAAQLGRQARQLFEEGRLRYLEDHGFEAKMVRYCDDTITGDNLAIIATKRDKPSVCIPVSQ